MLALEPPLLEAAAHVASLGFVGFVVGVFTGALWSVLRNPDADPIKWGAWGSAWLGLGAIVYFLSVWAGLH